jgi:predicted nucleic acid-binding Zn ribbon protein
MDLTDLSSLIDALRPSFRSPEQQQLDAIVTAWAIALGEHIAANSRPMHYERQKLTIAVRQAIWAQQLTAQTHQILQHLNPHLPPQIRIQTLRFRVASYHCLTPASAPTQPSATLSICHPSRWPIPPEPRTDAAEAPAVHSPPTPSPQPRLSNSHTLQQTVNRWKTKLDRHAPYLQACPRCRCLAPPAELDRWQMCAVCATSLFQSSHPLGTDRPAFEAAPPQDVDP